MNEINKKFKFNKGDKGIWMVYLLLCTVSLVEVFSASSGLTYKSGNFMAPLLKHGFTIFAGIVMAVIFSNIPCRFYKILTYPMLWFSGFMLLLVWAIGSTTNGANRWFDIGGFQFQPSEIAKGTVIVAAAQVFAAMQTPQGTEKRAFWDVLGITLIICFLIVPENLSTAALLFCTIYCMMIIARVPMRLVLKMTGIIVAVASLALGSILLIGDAEEATYDSPLAMTETSSDEDNAGHRKGLLHRADTWKKRMVNFFERKPENPHEYDLDANMQVGHANIAIVNSNGFGVGPGNSLQRDYLPQAYSDFIFAIICEEMGIIGGGIVMFMYIVLLFRSAMIAFQCKNAFPAFLVMGLSLLISLQAMFNMLVAVGILPVTGQPLPLISKGGTSIIVNSIYIGMILSVSHSSEKVET